MRQRTIIATTFVVLLIAGGLAAREYLTNWLHIENKSGQSIKTLSIAVGGQTLWFENIPAGSSRLSRFRIVSDDSFAVHGELADGTRIDSTCGYVTNGMFRERARFVVAPNGGVELDQHNGPDY